MIGLTQQEQVEFERIKDEMWNNGYETAKNEFGWHPASELPLLDKNGNSEPIVVICEKQGRLSVPKNAYVAGGVYTEHNVKYWCYLPKE